ncbi:hypothetical protein JAAARDRAFT_57078 [Jaapia argillacea MUCL 33604]|uniref:GRF-type domain-containing protein n=1 Tax=Jaapia argillacea MUCL 33604 TaxID=933084 RepID=A0A067Q937_9AGAM|nr:hypothetical protein JAAARDRAFT_57078 [Jaapia argillacea MUCL 33604]
MVTDHLLPPPYNCNECGSNLLPIKVSSNKAGNRGRLFITCKKPSRDISTTCKYFRWLTRWAQSTHALQPRTPIHRVTPHPMAGLTSSQCALASCKKVRINLKCTNHMCRTCCIGAGGCLFKDHITEPTPSVTAGFHTPVIVTSNSASNPLPPLSLPPSSTPSHPSSTSSSSSPSTVSASLPSSGASSSSSTASLLQTQSKYNSPGLQAKPPPNPLPNLRFSSHMTAVHTKQLLDEQQRQERLRRLTSEKKDAEKKVREEVMINAWVKDGNEPIVQPFQPGDERPEIQYPLVTLSATFLKAIGFDVGGLTHIHIRHPARWIRVEVGYVHKVKSTGEPIFLKALSVNSCPSFDKLWQGHHCPPHHIRKHLPVERVHVRESLRQLKLMSTSSSMTAPSNNFIEVSSDENEEHSQPYHKRKATSSSDVASCPVIRRHDASPSNISLGYGMTSRNPDPDPQHSPLSFSGRLQPSSPPRVYTVSPSPHQERSPSVIISSPRSPLQEDGPSGRVDLSTWMPKSRERAAGTQWPRDFYVRDVVDGFERIDNAVKQRESTVQEKFLECFGVEWAHRTYYEHRSRWRKAPLASQTAALEAGYSQEGLWSTFMLNNPASNAESRATSKRLKGKGRQEDL